MGGRGDGGRDNSRHTGKCDREGMGEGTGLYHQQVYCTVSSDP